MDEWMDGGESDRSKGGIDGDGCIPGHRSIDRWEFKGGTDSLAKHVEAVTAAAT